MKKVTGTKVKKELSPVTASECVDCCKEIDELTISFPNEDMNKVVEKINEIIKEYNGSL